MSPFQPPWMLWYVTALHMARGVGVLCAPVPLSLLPYTMFPQYGFTSWITGSIYLGAALLAILGLMLPVSTASARRIWWFLPQQALLTTSMVGHLRVMNYAIAEGLGVPFIEVVMLQLSPLLLLIFYTLTLLRYLSRLALWYAVSNPSAAQAQRQT